VNLAVASEIYSKIVPEMQPNTITFIGEKHKRPESIHLFKSIITEYLHQNKCLIVALEIASSQQSILDKVMEGSDGVDTIQISSIIDHPNYREMISELAELKKNGSCIRLIAIDADLTNSMSRDEWMAKVLAFNAGKEPILALLGNLHVLKKVNWNFENNYPYVAEILASSDFQIRTYLQIWPDDGYSPYTRLISTSTKEAIDLINNNIITKNLFTIF